MKCKHPEDKIETIAQKEYPGGAIEWCSVCGAWRDVEDPADWILPDLAKTTWLIVKVAE